MKRNMPAGAVALTALLTLVPLSASEPPGAEPMVVEEVTHAHVDLNAESGGCVGDWNMHVSAKTLGLEYHWYLRVNGVDIASNTFEEAPLHHSEIDIFALEDEETLTLAAKIWNPAVTGDESFATDSTTCHES